MEDSAMAKWNNMTNVTFDEIQVGASAILTRTLAQTDIDWKRGREPYSPLRMAKGG
jgi:hypothetical protein